ncbi:hypothetical protein CFP56_029513 [Quercus suber]|uniref:Uncharacterized protein n=1 Tax=Quercus suber TaxID=58331 RepID=A0AAW0JSS5_QUESU
MKDFREALTNLTKQSLGLDWTEEWPLVPESKCSQQLESTTSQVHFQIIVHCGFVLMMKMINFTRKDDPIDLRQFG